MTIVAFEKEVSLKAQAYLAKRLFDSTEVLYLSKRKHLISINGKKKFKRILNCLLVEGEKFRLRNLPSTSSLSRCCAANSVGASLKFAAFRSGTDAKYSRASASRFFYPQPWFLRRSEHIFPEKHPCVYLDRAAINKE